MGHGLRFDLRAVESGIDQVPGESKALLHGDAIGARRFFRCLPAEAYTFVTDLFPGFGRWQDHPDSFHGKPEGPVRRRFGAGLFCGDRRRNVKSWTM
jgi:hypothetical protein